MKSYFAYQKLDNRPARGKRRGVLIHLGECRYCNSGKGTRQQSGGRWFELGVYDWPREAMARAETMFPGDSYGITFCQRCIGQGVQRT